MKRLILFFLLVSATSITAFGLEWQAVDVEIAFSWQYNAQIGGSPDGKYPSIIIFNPGVSFFADLDGKTGGTYFRPGGWFSWSTEDVFQGIARPGGEAKNQMKVLGLMADAHWGYAFKAGRLVIGVQGGPSLYLRFPLWVAQQGNADPADFWNAYYGKLQFLYLGIASWVMIPVSDTLDFLPGLRLYQNISNLWTSAPFVHGLQIALTVSLRFGAFNN